MKKYSLLKSLLITATLLFTVGLMPATTWALNFDFNLDNGENTDIVDTEKDPEQILEDITKGTGLNNFSNETGRNVVETNGLQTITATLNRIINIIKWALGTVAVLYLLLTAYQLLTATDQADDVYSKAKNNFVYIGIGLFSVFAIDIFVNQVFVLSDGNFLGSVEEAKKFAGLGSRELKGIYNLAELFLGIFAVLMIVLQGFKLVANAGNEEAVDNAKRNITWAVAGLVLVGLAEFVIKDILFVDAGQTFDVNKAKQLIVSLTNFVSGFIAVAAVLMGIYAGYLYIFSGVGEDNTEKVKKAIFGAVIGILIAGGAFAIVNTLVKFEQPQIPELIQNQVDSNI